MVFKRTCTATPTATTAANIATATAATATTASAYIVTDSNTTTTVPAAAASKPGFLFSVVRAAVFATRCVFAAQYIAPAATRSVRAGTGLADLRPAASAFLHAKAADLFAALAVLTVLARAVFAQPSYASSALGHVVAAQYLAPAAT